jgi:hypothetical protein
MESRHISVWIHRPAAEVYRFAADPANLPHWAAGVDLRDVSIEFAPANDLGVLDHIVTVPGQDPVYNSLRVLPDGPDRCEVVFNLRRRSMSDAQYRSDADAVAADLATLKRLMECRG